MNIRGRCRLAATVGARATSLHRLVKGLLWFVLPAIVLFAASSVAAQEVTLSVNETARQADAIVLGTVTSKQSRWGDSSQRWMVTDYALTVESVIYSSEKWEPDKTAVTLTYWGGTIGSETQAIADVRLPVVGERLVLFLRPNWERQVGFTPVVGLNQGLFRVTPDVAGGADLVREAFGNPLELAASGDVVRRPDGLANTRAVSIETFTNWLRGNINTIKARPSERPPAFDRNDPRVMKTFAKQPSFVTKSPDDHSIITSRGPFESAGAEPSAGVPVPLSPSTGVLYGQPGTSLYGNPVPPSYVTLGPKPNAPIVVNNLPDSFTPWSPEDEYQMSKWNYYASEVFRVYTTPKGTYAWPDGVFDLSGWPSSADLQRVYGSPWGANTIGVTFWRSSGSTIVEADIALNPAFSFTLDDEWILNGAGNVQSFRLTMLHELGHMLGLDHNFNYLAAMNYFPSLYRFFGLPYMDDAQGIRFLYPSRVVNRTDLGVYLYYASGSQSVSDATYPGSVVAGGSLTFNNYHIENVGTNTISTPTIEWYLTSARNYNSSYYYLGQATYSSLAPFTYFTPSTVQRTFAVPANVPPGFYYLNAFIRNDSGASQGGFPFSNNYAFSRTRIQVLAASSATNLTPYQPSGWSDKIVVSNVTGTSTDSSALKSTDSLYVDWAEINNGSAATSATFYAYLYVDGVFKTSWFTNPPLNANSWAYVPDYGIGSLSAGSHTIRIVLDATNTVSETNEADNEYTKTITVSAPQTCNTLTANVSPSGGGTVTINTAANCSSMAAFPETDLAGDQQPIVVPNASSTLITRSPRVEEAFSALIAKAEASGPIHVIVGLDTPFQPEGILSDTQQQQSQRNNIAQAQDSLLSAMAAYHVNGIKKFPFIPYLALQVDAAGLAHLKNSPGVTSIEEDLPIPMALAESVPMIGGTAAWAAGYTGAGQTVAILDSGVDKNHPFLSGKVVSEACYSTTDSSYTSLCPGGVSSSTSPGSGVNCNPATNGDCKHGTHVAGIAAGKGTGFSGVAKDANIIAIQVFSRPNSGGRLGAYNSDMISGLQRVQALSGTFSIAAVNMSIGGGSYTSNCDALFPSFKTAIDNLRSVGIATVISSGNEYNATGIGSPACISTSISTGSVDDGSGGTTADQISDFSNSASFLTLLAPGRWINSSVPGGSFENFMGTSMAAPHVTGAWAVLKSKSPSATVNQVLSAFTSTGVQRTDSRNNVAKPRIKVDAALNALGGGASRQYTSGTVVTLTATPSSGYTFQSWSGCTSVSGNTCTATMNTSKTVTANFTPIQVNYTITVSASPSGAGTVSGGGTFAAGSSRTVTATPNTGYTFTNWTQSGVVVSTSASYTFTLNSNRTLVANFSQINYTISLSTSPSGAGTVSGGGTFAAGSSRTVTATPNTGYIFTNWTQSGVVVSTSASYTFILNSNRTLVANFSQNQTNYTISLSASPSGAGIVSGGGTFAAGSSRTVTATPNTGYIFTNWTQSGVVVSTSASYTFILNSNRTLVANFSQNQTNYTISLSASPSGAGTVSGGGTFAAGSSRTVTATPSSGYAFNNWTEGGNIVSTSASYTFVLNGNRNLVGNFGTSSAVSNSMRAVDFDGDRRADPEIWRPSTGVWYITINATGSFRTETMGAQGDIPVSGDYDGDDKADVAYWRPSTGVWTIRLSSNGTFRTQAAGMPGDVPVPADFDGDRRTDYAIWRPSTGAWQVIRSSNGSSLIQTWGMQGDTPQSRDFDGDGKADLAFWRPSTGVWNVLLSSNGSVRTQTWGTQGDVPVAGDFDGDSRADFAVWRPSTGGWYVRRSSNGSYLIQTFGVQGDVPLSGDFDSDGKADLAVWRPSTGVWYAVFSSSGSYLIQTWGRQGDIPGNR